MGSNRLDLGRAQNRGFLMLIVETSGFLSPLHRFPAYYVSSKKNIPFIVPGLGMSSA